MHASTFYLYLEIALLLISLKGVAVYSLGMVTKPLWLTVIIGDY